jgi:DnaJ-class molecular chaperone
MVVFVEPYTSIHGDRIGSRVDTAVRDFPETMVCPKCLGHGQLRLLRRSESAGAFELCPSCQGSGIAPRRNGAADYSPARVT